MSDEIKIYISLESCKYFGIGLEEYKTKLRLAFHDFHHKVNIDTGNLTSDQVFPLSISLLTGASSSQQSEALEEVWRVASGVFHKLVTDARSSSPLDSAR